MSNWR